MNDQFEVKIFYSHILKISAVMLVFFMSTLSESYANTENDKKSKTGSGDEKKATSSVEVKEEASPDATNTKLKIDRDKSDPNEPTYFQPTYLDQKTTSSGEDQNAVLSFNVIQYIFQRFKFSEEVY